MNAADTNLYLAMNALNNHDVPLAKIYVLLARKYLREVKV